MPVLIADHQLKDYDAWFAAFTANPPPKIGRWRVLRGTDDPNHVRVVAEMEPSEVGAVKQFLDSDEMRDAFNKINEISDAPIKFVWLDEVKPR